MKMMKFLKVLFFCVLLLMAKEINAQQQAMYTQYMFNGLAINPAYAGSHETLSLTTLLREQWLNIEGAPSTQTVSLHAPIERKKIALGLLLMNDRIGVINQSGVYGSYAYKINFQDKGTLSMGISAGFSYYDAAFSQVAVNDPSFTNNDVNEFHPNVGLGFYYYTNSYFAGISSPQILETTFNRDSKDSDSRFRRHYFFTAGKVFDIDPDVKLKSSVLLKVVEGAPSALDLNASVLLQEVLWLGLSYRSFDSFNGILRIQFNPAFQIGYGYDFITTSELSRINGGSHELMLNYRFRFSKKRVLTPRYF
jgi:type IX secretion system PorP/SprF family membrane protein